jgi:hypothetical protein
MRNPKTWDTDDLRDVAWQIVSGDDGDWPKFEKMPRKEALKIVKAKFRG